MNKLIKDMIESYRRYRLDKRYNQAEEDKLRHEYTVKLGQLHIEQTERKLTTLKEQYV